MEFENLLYAFEVYKNKSIKETAIRLGVSNPNLINKIKSLEEALGFEIFIKTNKGVILTPKGEIFIKNISPLINYYNCFDLKYNKDKQDNIIIASNHVPFAENYFFKVCTKLPTYLDILKYENLSPNLIMEGLLNRNINLAFLNLFQTELSSITDLIIKENLEYKILNKSPLKIYLNKESMLSPNETLSLKDLKNMYCLEIQDQHSLIGLDLLDKKNISVILVNDINEMLLLLDNDSFFIGDELSEKYISNIKSFAIEDINLTTYTLLVYNKSNKKGLDQLISLAYKNLI